MRVSCAKSDPGYVENYADYEVFLNGLKLDGCITADEEKRIVVVNALDGSGRPVLTLDKTGVMKEVLHGKIEIKVPV